MEENVNKSIYFNQPASQSAAIRIESAGDKGVKGVKITQEIVTSTGKKGQTVEETALDGSDVRRPSGPSGADSNVTRSFRSISPNVWERILKAPGDIRHGYWPCQAVKRWEDARHYRLWQKPKWAGILFSSGSGTAMNCSGLH
jgi:hypothetical protein